MEYPIDRFAMEAKRQLDVLDRHLGKNQFMSGSEYSIADIAIWPWYGGIVNNVVYEASKYLDTASYKNLVRWTDQISERDAVQRGQIVNRTRGPLNKQLHERHDSKDFETKTQDKIKA